MVQKSCTTWDVPNHEIRRVCGSDPLEKKCCQQAEQLIVSMHLTCELKLHLMTLQEPQDTFEEEVGEIGRWCWSLSGSCHRNCVATWQQWPHWLGTKAASGRRCWISLVLEAATRWPTAGLIRIIGAVMGTTSAHSWVARAWRPCHLMWQARHLTWRVDPPCIGPQGPLFVVNVKSLAFWTKARSFVRGWTDQKWLLGCPGKEVRIKG